MTPLQKIYKQIAPTYELTNTLMTFGLDGYWRRQVTKEAQSFSGNLPSAGSGVWLDCCCGTGDLLLELDRIAGSGTSLYGVDFSEEMFAIARSKKYRHRIEFIRSNAYTLPFLDGHFDLVTVSFAMRNLRSGTRDLRECLKEFYRVLKPGGVFLNIETSQPRLGLIHRAVHLYVRAVLSAGARLVPSWRAGFRYLSHSIKNFYSSEELKWILEEAGFERVICRELTFGVTATHIGVKGQKKRA